MQRGASQRNAQQVTAASERTADNTVTRMPTMGQTPMRTGSIAIPKPKQRKRIFISGVNSLIGHALFEQMRNDHMALRTGKKSNKFSGTIISKDSETVPPPNDQIKILDAQRKPKNFGKTIIGADIVVVDLVSGTDLEEAERIIQILRQPLHEHQTKK